MMLEINIEIVSSGWDNTVRKRKHREVWGRFWSCASLSKSNISTIRLVTKHFAEYNEE